MARRRKVRRRGDAPARDVTIAPTTATPSVWPTCRDVVAMADATPAWARGIPDTAALVIGALTKPKPSPKSDVRREQPGERGRRVDAGQHGARGRSGATPEIASGRRGPRRPTMRPDERRRDHRHEPPSARSRARRAAARGRARPGGTACSGTGTRRTRRTRPPRWRSTTRTGSTGRTAGRSAAPRGAARRAAGRAATAADAANAARMAGEDQPRLGASMIAVGQRGQQHDHQHLTDGIEPPRPRRLATRG